MTPRTLRVVTADDEPLALRRLRSLLEREPDVLLVQECSHGREVVEAVRVHAPDLLLLDIQMPGMTGLEVADALVGEGPAPLVIFTTAYSEHAVRAFDARAADYLLKPLDEARFAAALAGARRRLLERDAVALARRLAGALEPAGPAPPAPPPPAPPRRLVLRSGGRVTLLPADTVRFVEAEGDHLRVHTTTGAQVVRATLASLEAQLDPAEFVRIHRSTLVRLAEVRELRPLTHGELQLVLHDGTPLKLSRSYRARLEQALGALP